MGRKRSHTRRTPKARPRGVLEVAADGFGFVSTAEGDYFIPASKMGGAIDGDMVELAPLRGAGGAASSDGRSNGVRQRPVARVLRVIDRARDTIIGRYEVADPFGVVVPQDTRIPFDIFTMRSENPDIEHGSIVRVRMVEYPSRNTAATGVVEEVLGIDGAPGMDIEAIIARYRLETRFSDAALEEASQAEVGVHAALTQGYRDLRERFVFTIDPFDAKDFDDAISISPVLTNGGIIDATIRSDGTLGPTTARPVPKYGHFAESGPTALAGSDFADTSTAGESTLLGNGGIAKKAKGVPTWRLGIHIADVSHYVEWGSAIDVDARKRATSTYLVDRVLPMLPEALSNGVCSLVPGQPRRAFTLDAFLDADMKLLSVDFYPSVIQSAARLSYDQAQRYIDASLRGLAWTDAAAEVQAQPTPQGALPLSDGAHESLFHALSALNRFARIRMKAREAAGGIDFDTAEAKVQLDAEGAPIDVILRRRTDATSCVEEAMIFANECVARRLRDTQTPGIFRVHEAPSTDALASLVPVIQEFGYDAYIDIAAFVAGNPAALQALLARAAGRVEEPLMANLLLRAQQRAVYRAECLGHFGLASEAYCHFTSPIRRYPDLVVHRMLRSITEGKTEGFQAQSDALAWLAEHSSKMERVAEAASRDSQDLKLVEYMQRFIGQEFDGIVSGVASYGIYVQLENTAEGLLPTRNLGAEYFSLDPAGHRLTGQDTGRVFRLGQRIRVRIQASAPHARKLDLSLA